ncbi:YhfT family protein [Microbispora sp. H11081]|uniref:YhfT family protein n=1 Tax=Microbispora sp. H11081 TaxID=2729107 RepID=UPI001475626B|nr:YhfT family protein [Microbispora sp. H11081]
MTIGHAVTLPVPFIPSVVLFAAIGALASALAHRGVSVFHDGLRPVMGSFRKGELPRKEVSKTSFNLAWGFFWAFGIPFSIGYVIPLVYMIFMATDWIGVTVRGDQSSPWHRTARARRGVALALLAGGLWGAAMAVLLRLITEVMHRLPIEMASPVQLFSEPAAGAYFLFAVLTIAYHYGYRRAFVALVACSVAWFGARTAGLPYPAVWSFTVGIVFLLAFLILEARRGKAAQEPTVAWAVEDDDDEEEDVFDENARRIRRALLPIVALAALMGAAYNWGLMTKDPISGLLYAQGLAIPAALIMLAWAFAFIPMKFTTAAVTGCMATGTFLDQGIAMLMPNPWAAAAACAALRAVEVLALVAVVRGIERLPSIREVADVMRTAIFHVMEIGFLIGGALAASAFAGQWGFAIVIAAWFLNSRKNFPVMPMSVGAYAALAVGVFVNILAVLGFQIT